MNLSLSQSVSEYRRALLEMLAHLKIKLLLSKVILYILWLVVLFISLAVAADDYFCPAIEIISKTLRFVQQNITKQMSLIYFSLEYYFQPQLNGGCRL